VVVSGFIAVAVGLPLILSRVGRKEEPPHTGHNDSARGPSLRDWSEGEFTTWQDHLKGANAAAETCCRWQPPPSA
jgi:hypothetical protein